MRDGEQQVQYPEFPFVSPQSLPPPFYLLPIHLCTITQSHTCGHTLGIYELQLPPTPITPIPSHPGVSGEWRCCFSGWHTPLHIWNAHKESLSGTYTESITSGCLVVRGLMHHSFKVQVQDTSMNRQLTWILLFDHNKWNPAKASWLPHPQQCLHFWIESFLCGPRLQRWCFGGFFGCLFLNPSFQAIWILKYMQWWVNTGTADIWDLWALRITKIQTAGCSPVSLCALEWHFVNSSFCSLLL